MPEFTDRILQDAGLEGQDSEAAALEALAQVLDNGKYEYEDGDKELTKEQKQELIKEIEARL